MPLDYVVSAVTEILLLGISHRDFDYNLIYKMWFDAVVMC